MSNIERDLIGRDLRELSLYCKAYAAATKSSVDKLKRYIQDYKDYLSSDDLRFCCLCLVETESINDMAERAADPPMIR